MSKKNNAQSFAISWINFPILICSLDYLWFPLCLWSLLFRTLWTLWCPGAAGCLAHHHSVGLLRLWQENNSLSKGADLPWRKKKWGSLQVHYKAWDYSEIRIQFTTCIEADHDREIFDLVCLLVLNYASNITLQFLTVESSHSYTTMVMNYIVNDFPYMYVCIDVYVCMYMYVYMYMYIHTIIDELLSMVCVMGGEQWGRSTNERRRVDALGVGGRGGHRGDRNLWWPPNLIVQRLRVYGILYHDFFNWCMIICN